ncbi:hypothetical protein OG762_16740 [Streptomyces sp. NBC_01136]|uniref:hypothetical protein n=1 Tax=unclassified Streptomyces TaxID=2593676 RepID=UPI0032463780|nr:hypothetical protein OG762_16740 [Streptomyces sp. NBC_01136]
MTGHIDVARLLPWAGPEGKPCYLASDGSGGYLSRLADNMERMQLSLAADLVKEARDVLDGRKWTSGELHLLTVQLTEALTDVHRIAESRGARLAEPMRDDPDVIDVEDDEDDEDDAPARRFETSA